MKSVAAAQGPFMHLPTVDSSAGDHAPADVEEVGQHFTAEGKISWLRVGGTASHLMDAACTEAVKVLEVGTVESVRVLNRSSDAIFLRSDTLLSGGKQTRITVYSVLVPPHAESPVPVRCVERGRWHPESTETAQGFSLGSSSSRSMRESGLVKKKQSFARGGSMSLSQGEMWQDVDEALSRVRVRSQTACYLHAHRVDRQRLLARAKQLQIPVPDKANGVLVQPRQGRASVEVFPTPASLRAHAHEVIADLLEAQEVASQSSAMGLEAPPILASFRSVAEVVKGLSSSPCVGLRDSPHRTNSRAPRHRRDADELANLHGTHGAIVAPRWTGMALWTDGPVQLVHLQAMEI